MFVISSLGPGGAERVASTLIDCWARSGVAVTLVTLDSIDKDFYTIDSRVQRIALNVAGPSLGVRQFLSNNFERLRKLRMVIRSCDCDVVVSFIDKTNILVLLSTLGLPVPVIVSEHTDPREHSIGRIAALLRIGLYRRAHAVVLLTPTVANWARRIVPCKLITVIPNPIAERFTIGMSNRKTKSRSVIALGRMGREKGFDLLLRAFAQCAERHRDWKLRIVGDGAERARLETLVDDLGIGERVELGQVTTEPEKALQQADLFVLSSRYEGFPMALLEAMACGLPVISFDCRSGPREIIRDGVDGLLVPNGDVNALAVAMSRLMESEEERKRLGKRAAEVKKRFGLPRVMTMWSEVFATLPCTITNQRTKGAPENCSFESDGGTLGL